jgi:RecA/RadA recombinase
MSVPDDADALTFALHYARRGLRVVPIAPGTKRPPMAAWQNAATTDEDTIVAWFTGPYCGHGVGIATGPESGVFALDVDLWESFRELELRHEALPDTLTNLTGSGGTHFLFRYPTDGRRIRNNASTRLGAGLDIRGDGGQIVVAPTVHPNGNRYQWDAGQGEEIAEAPEWLLDLICDDPPAPPRITLPDTARSEQRRPGDALDAVDWDDILTADGWTLAHTDRRTGERHWTRPGKDARDGTSATTGYTANDNLKIFTTSMAHAGLEPDEVYTKLGYVAATRHHGDHTAAAAALRAAGYGAPAPATQAHQGDEVAAELADPVGGWELVDLGDILDGDYVAPTPTIGVRSDGQGLIYPGRVHSISGEPGGGKTWLALHILAEVIHGGGIGAFIDYEDTAVAAVHRLRLVGLTDRQIRTSFRYVHPDGPLVTKGGKVDLAAHDLLEALDADVVVIDSVGESLAVEGLPPNDDDAVAQWFRRLPRMLTRSGAAVIGLDHVTKSKDDRGLWAIGSQRKLAAIDGAAYGVDVIVAPTKTKDGKLKVTCAKDRHGTYQRGHQVATATINNAGPRVVVELVAPAERFRPTMYMQRVSEYLEAAGPTSARQIEQNVQGKGEVIRTAIVCLVEDGFVAQQGTAKGSTYTSVTPFRDEPQPVDNSESAPPQPVDNSESVDRVPPRPHRVPLIGDAVLGTPESDRVPRVPDPLRSRGLGGTRSEAEEATPTTPTERVRVPLDLSEF